MSRLQKLKGPHFTIDEVYNGDDVGPKEDRAIQKITTSSISG